MPIQHRILALIFTGFEALDVFGPLGCIIPHHDYYSVKAVNVNNFTSLNTVESFIENGIGTIVTLSFADALKEDEHFDSLFIPGGLGVRPLLGDQTLLQQIGQLVDRAPNVFTVCTGSALLAATGRMDGRQATTNKRVFDDTTAKYPHVEWQKHARWVQDRKFLTSSGITAGIDAGFAFLANTYVAPEDRKASPSPQEVSAQGNAAMIPGFDKDKALEYAQSVASTLEYRWDSDPTDDPFSDVPQQPLVV